MNLLKIRHQIQDYVEQLSAEKLLIAVEFLANLADQESDNLNEDTTDYLLSTEANKQQLLEAMDRVKNEENLVVISEQEWHDKYSI